MPAKFAAKLRFEPAIAGDEAILQPIYRDAFTEYAQRLGREVADANFARIADEIVAGHVWKTLRAGEIVGATTLIPQDDGWEIDEIVVAPSRQGQGIGSWMLGRIERLAREQDASRLYLHTAKLRDDLIGLYRRHGFAVYREGPPAHGLDEHIRVHMEKLLG